MLKRKTLLTLTALTLFFTSAGQAFAADKTSKYRVYQDTTLLLESSDYKAALNYARTFTSSHVEEIGTRQWLWDNYPRYKVYQNGYSSRQWEFATLDEAIAEARNWGSASVRDLQSGGWAWNNYGASQYRLYQGDNSMDGWVFATLDQAIAEGKKWGGAHIVDLGTNRWVWDNLNAADKSAQRAGAKVYRVQQGTYTVDAWNFAYLEDAVNESLRWNGSTVVNTTNGKQVFANTSPFTVYQYTSKIGTFPSINDAVSYAKQFSHTTITSDNAPATYNTIWTNFPYYQVFQNDAQIADFNSPGSAVTYALGYSSTTVRLQDSGATIWDNLRKLQFWGWNGVSTDSTIRSQVNGTSGLDVVSPTYFQLADNAGNLTDSSNKDTVAWLKSQRYTVYPLVHNQFDPALTTQFLASASARAKFIGALVDKASALGVHGLNIDFESVSGKDRANFTTFMTELVQAAHAKNLVISVDLPRGSVKWNAQTAFDHEKLASIVDYIVTMTYDQYWKGSTEPGSVAGLSWVEEGIKEFLAYGIPRDKLIMGIPFYVREWKIDAAGGLVSNRAVLLKDIPALLDSTKATLTWDARFGQYKAEYSQDGYKYVFWLENDDTAKARVDIAKKYQLGGVAAWRLGYDTKTLWNALIQQK